MKMLKHRIFLALLTLVLLTGIASASEETITVTKADTPLQFQVSAFFPDAGIASATWDFADDTVGSGLDVTHSFLLDGVYTVAVNATDGQGKSHQATRKVMVGGWIPYYSDQAYLTMYLEGFPDGSYNMTVSQDDTTAISTSSYITGGKFWTITSNLPNGGFSAELVFRYDDADDNGIVDGTSIDENKLWLYYYNGASWVAVPDQPLNASSNNVIATVDHFTVFALLAPTSASPPSGNSGSGGGGGGGGGITANGTQASNKTNQTAAPIGTCQESWTCSDWSACINGTQTRACRDANNCGTSGAKPLTVQACSLGNETNQVTSGIPSSNDWMIGLFVGVIVMVSVIYVLMRRRSNLVRVQR